jgi:hypothetical protein
LAVYTLAPRDLVSMHAEWPAAEPANGGPTHSFRMVSPGLTVTRGFRPRRRRAPLSPEPVS